MLKVIMRKTESKGKLLESLSSRLQSEILSRNASESPNELAQLLGRLIIYIVLIAVFAVGVCGAVFMMLHMFGVPHWILFVLLLLGLICLWYVFHR